MRPDFKKFRGLGLIALSHSAKGTTWDEHKYIKRIDGTYYYPDSYEGGRHLPDGEKSDSDKEEPKEIETDENGKLSETDVENLALEVIRGNFGNGQVRKDLLGEHYQQVQDRVNELMRSSSGSKKVSEVSEKEAEKGKEAAEKVVAAVSKAGLDFETIYSVYRKKS